jgi:hypothetical protein
MTARTVVAIGSLCAALASAGCLSFVEIPVEIPIQAKIDVSKFQRVLVVGFLAGGSKSIDPNTETVRLLRSQLRTKQDLRVVDGDVLSLAEEATKLSATDSNPPAADANAPAPAAAPANQTPAAPPPSAAPPAGQTNLTGSGSAAQTAAPAPAPGVAPSSSSAPQVASSQAAPVIKDEKDLEAYEGIFNDKAFWKRVGAEYESPLIVTGTVLFTEIERSGMVSRPQSFVDQEGNEQYRSVREYSDMKGYALTPKFIFIDGRTGEQIYSETYHEETLYPAGQNTPALSSYFELMDKLLPSFLNTLSTQTIKGSRVLLK